MLTHALKRPALGQLATLGHLYDARTDKFLPSSILCESILESAVHDIQIHTSNTKFSSNDSYKERFNKLAIGHDLGASFLAGLIEVDGSARYLTQQISDEQTVQETIYHTVTTVHEKINFSSGGIRDVLDFTKLSSSNATHVVAEISWGAMTVVSASHRLAEYEDRQQVVTQLKSAFQRFGNTLLPDYPDLSRLSEKHSLEDRPFNVKVFADILPQNESLPEDFDSAYRCIVNMPHYVSHFQDGKGVPLVYTLLPISFFSIFFGAEIKTDWQFQQINTDNQDSFVDLFDNLQTAQQRLTEHHTQVIKHRFCLPSGRIDSISAQLQALRDAQSNLRSDYAHMVKGIKSGQIEPQQMGQLLERFHQSDSAPTNIAASVSQFQEKMRFVDQILEQGGKYIGFNGFSLETSLLKSHFANAFVLYFSEKAVSDVSSWNENLTAFTKVLQHQSEDQKALMIIADCDATQEKLDKAYISYFENAQLVTKDWVLEQKTLADKCLARYDERAIDQTVANAPAQRRLVRIPCPGPDCDFGTHCDWVCFKCHSPIEYGVVDNYFYCDCGRSHFSVYEFKCKSPDHGASYSKYNKRKLQRLLENLEQPDELNILILGETGVGKSTFINAFVNYLTFSTLDEGLSAAKLNCVIPCSFSTQYVDHARGGRLVQKEVKFGIDEDELDSNKGQSATQKAVVYPLYLGHTLVRLIDTPGIGDVRGTEHDKKNMADVLSVLRNYPKLHGILVLLKPNNARLNVMFRFCIKELLTHLARDAAHNMVFGFTNTRGSNYQPGDTFRPLEALLSDYSDVIPGLFRDTVYCFDSESFRYLAARQKGIDMGNIEDYRRSWDHSALETRRMINYFRGLRPHDVKSTLSLNETRYLIANLTIPMAEISKSITKSIIMNSEDAKAIAENKLTSAELQSKLNLTKVSLTAKPLSRPRTVCSNSACIKMQTDNGKEVIVHKALCHNPCCLTDVPPNSIGTRQLQGCAAFNHGRCMKCSHGWQEHLHVVVEYAERSVLLTDPAVEKALAANATQIQVKEAAIAAKTKLIAELKAEHRMIQEAAAQFSVYLSKKSITLYNDATLEYLDHLIREEKSKVGFGADPTRLQNLEDDRRQYAEFVRTMTMNIDEGSTVAGKTDTRYQILDEEGVYALVSKLYALPHSGNDLKKVAKVVGTAYAATFREKPYRVKGKGYWMNNNNMAQPMRINGTNNDWVAGYVSNPSRSDPGVRDEKSALSTSYNEKDTGYGEMDEKDEAGSAAPPPYEPSPRGFGSAFSPFALRPKVENPRNKPGMPAATWLSLKGKLKKAESRLKMMGSP